MISADRIPREKIIEMPSYLSLFVKFCSPLYSVLIDLNSFILSV